MKVQWLQNFENERKDSTWYGGDIVTIKCGRYLVTIGAFGDIRAVINGNYYVDKCNGGWFREYLEDEHIHNDEELSCAIREGRIEFENNNWYEAIIWDNLKKDYVDSWDTIIDDLDRNDDFKWVKSWLKDIVR